jgi:glutaconate CoA-transferase subunit A
MKTIININTISEMVKNGDRLAIGGTWLDRKPMQMIRELVRSKKKDLELIVPIGGIDADMLLGAGCAKGIHFSYISLDIYGSAQNFRRAIERREVECREYSALSILLGLQAAAKDLPCLAMKELLGSDIVEQNRRHKIVSDPSSGERFVCVEKMTPDVAILHAQGATEDGTVVFRSGEWFDLEMANSARKVIVSVEEVVSEKQLEGMSDKDFLLRNMVDGIVFGAHPTSCYPYYVADTWHLMEYSRASRDRAGFEDYLREYIYSVTRHEDYVSKIGGLGKIEKLKRINEYGLNHESKRIA